MSCERIGVAGGPACVTLTAEWTRAGSAVTDPTVPATPPHAFAAAHAPGVPVWSQAGASLSGAGQSLHDCAPVRWLSCDSTALVSDTCGVACAWTLSCDAQSPDALASVSCDATKAIASVNTCASFSTR